MDCSPPGSSVQGILQARTLEWVAISFSSAWKWKVKVKSLSRVRLLATPWTVAHQAPPSMGFSRQVYCISNCLHFSTWKFTQFCLWMLHGIYLMSSIDEQLGYFKFLALWSRLQCQTLSVFLLVSETCSFGSWSRQYHSIILLPLVSPFPCYCLAQSDYFPTSFAPNSLLSYFSLACLCPESSNHLS